MATGLSDSVRQDGQALEHVRQAAPRSPYTRPFAAVASIVYALLYVQIYVVMGQYWDYLGFTLRGYDAGYHYVSYAFVALASLGVKSSRRTVGEFIVNTLFIILYVPCIITPFLQGALPFTALMASAALLTASFLFIGWFVHLGRHRVEAKALPQIVEPGIFWIGVVGLWLILNLYVFATFAGNLRLAGLSDVYEQRFLADSVVGGSFVYYAILNLSGGLNPFLLALGLRRRSLGLIGMALASHLLMYSTSALKAIIASVVLTIGFHFILGRKDRPRTNLALPVVLVVMVIGALLVPFYDISGGMLYRVMNITFIRTIMTPGVIYGIYLDFFSVYPTTSLSHVSVVRIIVEYPYGLLQIGQVVGQYLSNSVGLEVINANANYLATDGIASFWLAGIPVIGLISAVAFRFVDRLLVKTDQHLCCVTLLSLLIYLSNVSLFTAGITYGGVLVVGLLWLLPRSGISVDGGPEGRVREGKT